jgi:hypothetical protein
MTVCVPKEMPPAELGRKLLSPTCRGASLLEQMLQRGKLNNGETLDYAFGLKVGWKRL